MSKPDQLPPSDRDRTLSTLGCLDALEQCVLVARSLTQAQWTTAPAGFSAIGPHMRHSLDHFVCFFEGLPRGVVDYDSRHRDPRLERDPHCFLEALDVVSRQVPVLADRSSDEPIVILQTVGPGGEKEAQHSTLGRELAFLANHALHHLAIVKLLAAGLAITLPATLGVAYSTLDHERGKQPAQG